MPNIFRMFFFLVHDLRFHGRFFLNSLKELIQVLYTFIHLQFMFIYYGEFTTEGHFLFAGFSGDFFQLVATILKTALWFKPGSDFLIFAISVFYPSH